jgi:hypothetical protein
MRNNLKKFTEKFHMFIHVFLGFVVYVIFLNKVMDPISLMVVCVIGSVIADLDHIIYYFTYGRNSDYSKIAKGFLCSFQFKAWAKFCKENHKSITSLYSHNILVPITFLILTPIFFSNGYILCAAFCLSFSFHFIFDLLDDLLFFGRLNPNWVLKFNR